MGVHTHLGLDWATLIRVPELPEVETIRRQLDPLLRDCSVVDAWAFDSAKFTQAHEAVGWQLNGVSRRGKYLLIDLDSPTAEPTAKRELIVHLGMTGRLSVSNTTGLPSTGAAPTGNSNSWEQSTRANLGDAPALGHLRAIWTLDDGRSLYFDDVRRFGRIAVVPAGEHDSLATLAALGPEPFDEAFTSEHLRAQVNASKRCIKTQLLAQRVVAGLGNIYVDESLWRSQVHPAAKKITILQSQKLTEAIRDVLAAAINNGGTTLRNYRDAEGVAGSNQRYLDCYGRAGQSCIRCGTTLKRMVIDARATVFCPNCQRRP
ncbi:MAG: bifunctional DNA-formamidopyrimidine glycosylase/DNA-(apurinic or apyrimidinic site) lyase [Actinobacteria bacterium]|nr:bifunctional DNA-formamidopyrimidine glycosylase/DNA-(apurinic or apyrimidinic site) lyase [Actinomycetota bacterium]